MTRRRMLGQFAAFALKQGDLENPMQLMRKQTSTKQVSAATLLVRRGQTVVKRAFGEAKNTEAVFLLASITKPMTASALMVLADRGQVSLSDPVRRFIPEFKDEGRERISLRHLLTHTSGLPDMLPEDQELRRRHAPLGEFVERTCRTPLLFSPGAEVRYQSMGFLLAGEIVSRVAKEPLPAFLREHLFLPLGMHGTSLGLGGRTISQTMRCQVKEPSDWDWNSSYWRNLASPWGGAHSTVSDLSRFLHYFADPDRRVVKPETALSMVADQTVHLNKRWGLGWMLNDGQFGTGCSTATFGHSGSTGTFCWTDPKRDVGFVLLTTKPAEQSGKTLLYPVSDYVSRGV